MQTFMIPGTIVMSLLAGSLFGAAQGVMLVIFNVTAGASCCFFLSKLIGRPLALWMWPEKLRFFSGEVCFLICLFLPAIQELWWCLIFALSTSLATWEMMLLSPVTSLELTSSLQMIPPPIPSESDSQLSKHRHCGLIESIAAGQIWFTISLNWGSVQVIRV